MLFSSSEALYSAISVCILATVALGANLRRGSHSLGLPLAYALLLMIQHIPGAWAAAVAGDSFSHKAYIQSGMNLTAAGFCAFAFGSWIARRAPSICTSHGPTGVARSLAKVPTQFLAFCLLGGWLFTFVLGFLVDVPSINALIEYGSAVWLLAVIIGLGRAVNKRSAVDILYWTALLAVYPLFILVVGGFISLGTASVIVTTSILAIIARRYWLVILALAVAGLLAVSFFVNYFAIRDELRSAAWGGAPIAERASVAAKIVTEFKLVSSDNAAHMAALDKRLNQNYFIGLAAARLEQGEVEFLWGRSIWEGVLALVPRVVWPEKPVFGGSGDIVPEMTGLRLNRTSTAWGVGNVMEFYINFGISGLLVGFIALGYAIAKLDLLAARKLLLGKPGDSILYFLPCVALIQPLGSMVELIGGSAAAVLAGLAWRRGWEMFRPVCASTGSRTSARQDAPK